MLIDAKIEIDANKLKTYCAVRLKAVVMTGT